MTKNLWIALGISLLVALIFPNLLIFIILIWVVYSFFRPSKVMQKNTKDVNILFCDEGEEVPLNQWYRMNHWKRSTYVRYNPGKDWSGDWRICSEEEPIVGISHEDRQRKFTEMMDKKGFRLSLQRDTKNKFDSNAVSVIATTDDRRAEQIGYLSKEFVAMLKDEPDLDCRPHSATLASEGYPLQVNVTVLTRSVAWRKSH